MLTHPPLLGTPHVVRPFGHDSELFSAFQYKNQPIMGHTGLDLAAPPGTPVCATAPGQVLAARTDGDGNGTSGFGGYVLLRHHWGQTLYGRLQALSVRTGESIAPGTQIGTIAPSRAEIGTHLHFGMRILPYSVTDGWAGFTDPQPYLTRIAAPQGPIIGPHIIASIRPHLPALARWQPRMILVLDPSPDEVRELREVCPTTVIIARIYHPEHETEQRIRANPQAAAQWAHEKIMARWSPHIDYWQFTNEILQDRAGLPLLNHFELARMQIAESHGYKCAILAFSVGNPDLPDSDRMAHWRLVYPALAHAEANHHIVAVHQYGMPTLWGPDNAPDWYIHRLEHQVLRRLPYKKLRFAVTEFGIDGLLRGSSPSGWQNFTTPQNYAAQLIKAARYLERYSGRVLGYTIFTLGHYPPWGSYDIAGPAADMLADSLPRGVWADIDTHVPDIAPRETDSSTDPGPEALRLLPPTDPPAEPPDESPTDEPGENDEKGPDIPTLPNSVERRIVPEFAGFNQRIAALHERPDYNTITGQLNAAHDDMVYIVKDIFFTQDGNWDAGARLPVPDWARETYRTGAFIEAGANHHLFAAVVDAAGVLQPDISIRFWSDGFARLGDPAYTSYITATTKADSGWANLPIGPGSSYVPGRGESGPWCFAPAGAAEVICGSGLPDRNPISTFVVWQAIPRAEWEAQTGEEEETTGTPDGETTHPDEGDTDNNTGGDTGDNTDGPVAPPPPRPPRIHLERRLSPWVAHYNIGYTGNLWKVASPQDSSRSPADNDLVYLVKDIFTTRNGSWEPDNQPGSVPEWARAAYLRPLGAADYFDDAGGDHHLFGAVLGLNGELVRLQLIAYWSDGLEAIQERTYSGYTHRATKERSGWANIAVGPGSSFVPERGESGPWCWAPRGEAEVVWGGGLPSNHHISTFVVWQAVRRSDLLPPPEDSTEENAEENTEEDKTEEVNGETPDSDNGTEETRDRDYSIYIPVVIG